MADDIDIEHLTIDELVALSERVQERIKYLERHAVVEAMQRFNIGARVRFHPGRHGRQTGTLTKFNQKSVVSDHSKPS